MERTDDGVTLQKHAVTLLIVHGRECIVGVQIEDRVVAHITRNRRGMGLVAISGAKQRKAEGGRSGPAAVLHFAAAASPQCGLQKGAMQGAMTSGKWSIKRQSID